MLLEKKFCGADGPSWRNFLFSSGLELAGPALLGLTDFNLPVFLIVRTLLLSDLSLSPSFSKP